MVHHCWLCLIVTMKQWLWEEKEMRHTEIKDVNGNFPHYCLQGGDQSWQDQELMSAMSITVVQIKIYEI